MTFETELASPLQIGQKILSEFFMRTVRKLKSALTLALAIATSLSPGCSSHKEKSDIRTSENDVPSVPDETTSVSSIWSNVDFDAMFSSLAEDSPAKGYLSLVKQNCQAETVRKITANGRTVYFEVVEEDPKLPYIFFLPGGPGSPSIGHRIFKKINVINTDPRGLGCNYASRESLPAEELTTEKTAQDYIEIIRQLGIKNYLIYGHSYGTVVGTVLAHLIERNPGLPAPKALVLEGVVGGPTSNEDYFDGHKRQFDALMRENPDIAEIFANELPLGLSEDQWGFYFHDTGNNYLEYRETLKGLVNEIRSGSVDGPITTYLLNQVPSTPGVLNDVLPWFDRIMTDIGCHEITTSWLDMGARLVPGNILVPKKISESAVSLCTNSPLDRPYTVKDHQIKAPIHYFQGTHDPQTPIEGAKDHYAAQTKTIKKVFNEVAFGGHGPGTSERFLANCMTEVLSKIARAESYQDLLNKDGACKNANHAIGSGLNQERQ